MKAAIRAWLIFSTFALPFIGGSAEPVHALLVTGGCCHDYEAQKKILTEGISARANVTWTIIHEGTNREHQVSIYTNADWARGYDVVVHDECFGMVTNLALIGNITHAHSNGVPAVVLHCSIHSYREAATDEWRKLLGVTSVRHGDQHAFQVVNVESTHPVMKGFPDTWQDFPDELYQILKVWPDCTPLGKAVSDREPEQPCIWVNNYGKSRVFGTTLGHRNATVQSDAYLDLVTRGLLWACDKLDGEGHPKPGYGRPATGAGGE
jgi:uncharacterized protein